MEIIQVIKQVAEASKVFFWGFVAGVVIQYFEVDIWNKRFNPGRFLLSSCMMWILTQLSFFIIQGEIIDIEKRNSEKDIIISITLAAFLYLFIPFVLEKENRKRFIEDVLGRFWFFKKK